MSVLVGPVRTALFVPGNRPDRVDKAAATPADAIIIDLEDAVPPEQKKEVRPAVREKLLQHRGRKLLVRINSLGSGLAAEDLEQTVVAGLCGILLPKTQSADDIQEIDALLRQAEKRARLPEESIALIPLLESALAIENAHRIATAPTASPRIFTLAFGAADLALDMGFELSQSGAELAYVRARLAVACRAARREQPLDTPFMIDFKNVTLLEAEARRARQLGFQGKLCIHPVQLAVCNRVFSPTPEQIAQARRVIEAFRRAEAQGHAAIELDGLFIDPPVVERAKSLLALASPPEA